MEETVYSDSILYKIFHIEYSIKYSDKVTIVRGPQVDAMIDKCERRNFILETLTNKQGFYKI